MFTNLLTSSYQDIPWTLCIDSGRIWPIVVISALTHGGETAWLDVINFLIQEIDIQSHITSWKVVFLLSNIDAYTKYLTGVNFKDARYIDENMNRCATIENIRNGHSSESTRLRIIEPVLAHADYHIDIHSTTQSPMSMAIMTSKSEKVFGTIVNVDEQYIWLTTHQVGKPLMDICERSGGISIWLETWRQDDATAFLNGVDNVLRILAHIHTIPQQLIQKHILPIKKSRLYTIYGSIMVHDADTFSLSSSYAHGENVKKWTILATQDTIPIIIAIDSVVLLPSLQLYSWEEYCFLSHTY